MGHRLATEEEAEAKRLDANLLNIKKSRENVKDLHTMVADEVVGRDVERVVQGIRQKNAVPGVAFNKRLESAMRQYGAISESLPYPTVNPMILKQRRRLQKRADGWADEKGVYPAYCCWVSPGCIAPRP